MHLIRFIIIFMGLAMLIAPTVTAWENDTTISVLVDGWYSDSNGSHTGIFGIASPHKIVHRVASMLHIPDGSEVPEAPNQFVKVRYGGDTAPSYYTPEDTAEVTAAPNGVPRYALVVAKFIKHRLTITGAKHVNLFGFSFGGMISRYVIEKDLEGLASQGRFIRWMSLEGVVAGAFVANLASDPDLQKFALEVLGMDISSTTTMTYKWVTENVNDPRRETQCRFFKNILMGHQISSRDSLGSQLLTSVTLRPNDGVLLVEDMAFRRVPLSCCFHDKAPMKAFCNTNHISSKEDAIFLPGIAAFMSGSKRVTIRIKKAQAVDFKENYFWGGPGEVTFDAKVYSPYAAEKWQIKEDIARVSFENHTAEVLTLEAGKTKEVDAVIYDWLIMPAEKSLKLELAATEIDWDYVYNIKEDLFHPSEKLGQAQIDIPLTDTGKQTFHIQTPCWQVWLEVSIYDYNLAR